MLSVIYKFENQSLVIFEDNFKYLGDLPFIEYFDFETNTDSGTTNYLDDEEMWRAKWYTWRAKWHKLKDCVSRVSNNN